ncbi:MAG: SDR family NAD(P)-dependent oxidoreductase [Brevundimonas sp.]
MDIKGKTAVVTGGSRGLGLGLVEALVDKGVAVTVVARGEADLAAVRERLGVATLVADITDQAAATRIIDQAVPDILVLNAGARPPMARLDEISWQDFTTTWETDVKAALYWIQATLRLPLRPGSRVMTISSGAAVGGSQMSGGYGGAKRMLWFMAKYANGVSEELGLGIRYQSLLPRQMILGTGVGDRAAGAYAAAMEITPEAFVARFGKSMPPRLFGDHIVSILETPAFAEGTVFGLSGDRGVWPMDEPAA